MKHKGQGEGSKKARKQSGFSLLEIMIALPILALVSLALVSGTVFASRLSRIVCNQVAAKNIAQSYFERMAIDDFDDVTPANYPSVTLATSPPLYLDSVRNTRCTVDIVITGYGRAESGTASSLTDTDASWATDEWAGNTVLLIGGRGRGQRAQITGNSNNTLNLNATLNPTPDATTWYAINGGKTVRITTRWSYLGKEYRARIESLVINWGPRR